MRQASEKPLGIYIHIPFCKAKCGYCAFVSTPDFSLQKSYVQTLIGEIYDHSARGSAVDTVYIGGGTPSCLYRGAICEIARALKNTFDLDDLTEFTVECNPESVDDEFISECMDAGANRISMGLQSSCDDTLKRIGRVHDFACYLRAAELLRARFDNMSSDMILGLPGQGEADVERGIDAVLRCCSHVSVYALTVEADTPLFRSGYRPDDDRVADLYDLACEKLRSRGLERYEVSNFAKDGRQSKHNLKYWNCDPYLGLGVAAHGYDGKSVRYMHGNDIRQYISSPQPTECPLSHKDMFNEYIMLRLRTEKGIVESDFIKRFGYSIGDVCGEKIDSLKADGLIETADGRIFISPRYMFVMNGIIEELMLD